MRVALLTSANGWRGSGSSYAKLARGLGDRGHTAHLVTAAARLTSRLAAMELPVTEIPGRNTGPRQVWALLRVLREIEADALVVDTPRDVRLAAYATLLHPARIVYRYNLNYRRPRNDVMDRAYLSRVAACVYQSQYIQEDAIAHAPWMKRIRGFRIPNGYDLERYAPLPEAGRAFRERYRIRSDAQVVLTTAKLTRNKGHEVAIAALGRLHRTGTPVLYLVCGDGGREEELRGLARSEELPTVFTGLLEAGRSSARSPRRTWWFIRRSTRSSPMRSGRRCRRAGGGGAGAARRSRAARAAGRRGPPPDRGRIPAGPDDRPVRGRAARGHRVD